MYKTVSYKTVIAQIYRDFKVPHSGWVSDTIEWIGEAIAYMGCHTGYTLTSKEFIVCDHRVKLPCDMEFILGVEYKGHRLNRSGAINHRWKDCNNLKNLPCHLTDSYSLKPNYINTTFKDGCIVLYYYTIGVDCDGFPEVADNVKVKEAITWYIMMKLCLRGLKHQVVDYKICRQEWELAYPRAQNSQKFRDIDDLENFKKAWLGIIPPQNLMDSFWNNEINNVGNGSSLTPGILIPNPLNRTNST